MKTNRIVSFGGLVLLYLVLSAGVSQVLAEGGYVSMAIWDGIQSPRGIAKAPDDTIWLSEASPNNRIWRIQKNPDHSATFLEWFGGCTALEHVGEGHWHSGPEINHTPEAGIEQYGSGKPGMFDNPYGIAFDNLKKAYIVDQQNARVQILDSERTINPPFIGFLDDLMGEAYQFGDPRFVAVDSTNHVYVNEYFLGSVAKFDPSGTIFDSWPVVWSLQGIAVARDSGNIYTCAESDPTISMFSTYGDLLGSWGQGGPEPGKFLMPTTLKVGPDGNIFVSDLSYSNDSRIQVFSPAGQYLSQYIRKFGTDPDQAASVSDFFVDSDGFVYAPFASEWDGIWNYGVEIFAPIFTITSPNGGESVAADSTAKIRWIGRDKGTIPYVQVEYSLDNGLSWQPIETDVNPIPNATTETSTTGECNWYVPSVGSDQCRIRITADDGDAIASDISDNAFTIVNVIPAGVDMIPRILYKHSFFRWVFAFITLPTGYDVASIDVDTIAITKIERLCCPDCPPIEVNSPLGPVFSPWIGDYNHDGIPDLTVIFDCQDLLHLLQPGFYKITVSGMLETDDELIQPFEGSEIICVIGRCR